MVVEHWIGTCCQLECHRRAGCLLATVAAARLQSCPAAATADTCLHRWCQTLLAPDMLICSQALEERQRQLRATDGAPPPRLTSQHLYNTVNAQMGIIQAQVSLLMGQLVGCVVCANGFCSGCERSFTRF